MRNRNRIGLLIVLVSIITVTGCKKHTANPEQEAPETLSHGILVLNEGLFNQNNSSLSWINTSDHSVNSSFFEQKTGRGLGDTGNDLKRYGNKLYVVVNVSSTVEILDATTGKSLKQLSMQHNGVPKQPRAIAFFGGKAYITCYDGFVDVLDTAQLVITQRIPTGPNPEGLAVSNGKLYVANSGGLNYPNVDSTVSVIDLNTYQEITRITVGNNPGSVCVDSEGDIYVISRGNYSSIPSRMHRINTQTDQKEQTFSFDASGISLFNTHLLISYYDYSNSTSAIGLFNAQTEQLESASFINTSNIHTLYGVYYSPLTQTIYCSDANEFTSTGFLHLFQENGAFIRSYSTGLNPSKIIVYE